MESNPLLKTQEEIDNIIRYLKKCPEEYTEELQNGMLSFIYRY